MRILALCDDPYLVHLLALLVLVAQWVLLVLSHQTLHVAQPAQAAPEFQLVPVGPWALVLLSVQHQSPLSLHIYRCHL